MSLDYWGITGYGIRINDIGEFNKEKVNALVRDLNPNVIMDNEDVLEDDTFCGNLYANFAEFLCDLDKTNTLCYDDNGNGECYLLYSPPYPWMRKNNEPTSYEDIENRILDCLVQVSDQTRENLAREINYISDAGWA